MAFNNGPKLVTQGLNLLVDAGDPTSYPGTGTTWRDVVGGQNGIITGSVSYTSSFYGGLVFSGPTASVIFPTSSANFGTASFTVELAFRPARIEGIHYLVSKNSGSFPNWGIYLSGSGGQGKLFSEFRISSTVSCSVSSSTTFVTGSNYDVTVKLAPGLSGSAIFVDGNGSGITTGNGGGSLTSTGSLLIGNIAPSSSQAYSGSLYNTKIYSISSLVQPVQNYNAIASRLAKTSTALPVFELLVVGGGGSGGGNLGGGGGAGGLQYFPSFTPSSGILTATVGAGGTIGTGGSNSTFNTLSSIGGGSGGVNGVNGGSGGSGGGGYRNTNPTGGTGSIGQGNNGGTGANPGSGGGGGAGSAGQNGTSSTSGNGGSGSYIASFAAIGGFPAGWFAGGGGGGFNDAASIGYGGPGGGGNGGFAGVAGSTGSVNTGGGGGGGGNAGGGGIAGGSGIVAIRYNGAPIAVGGEITQSGGFTYHVYRTVGTSSFTIF